MDLNDRFPQEVLKAFQMASLLPYTVIHLSEIELQKRVECLLKNFAVGL